MHAGLFDAAAAELSEYFKCATKAAAAGREDPFDLRLTQMLRDLIESGGEVGGLQRQEFGQEFDAAGAGAAAGGEGAGVEGPSQQPQEKQRMRQTLLAPGAGGSSPARSAEAAAGGEKAPADPIGNSSGGSGGGGDAQLMSIRKILESAALEDGVAASGGLLGAQRSKLPLTW